MKAVNIIVPKCISAKHTGFVLPNGVKCIVVQDSNAKVSAAAMSIHAGQLRDPEYLPGLAHFCEHMLFMGTDKYPQEDAYEEFISKHGGYTNAWTGNMCTTYYFKVATDALEGALDHFVEFFVSPLFSEGATAREVKAVHSEDEKNHSIEYWRTEEVYRALYNVRHPLHRYGNGNYTTLWTEPKEKGVDIRDELKAFHSANYIATNACIAVYSPHPPEVVLSIISPTLSKMKEGTTPPLQFLEPDDNLFSSEALGSWVNIKSLRKNRSVDVRWQVRCERPAVWSSMPACYISHILGHECDCSVLGLLKKWRWATEMVVGPRTVDDSFQELHATIGLTQEGFARVTEVVALLYEAIGQSIAKGVNMQVYHDTKMEHQLGFEVEEMGESILHCSSLTTTAHNTDLEHCWIGETVVLKDDIEAVEAYTRQLTPENAVVTLSWSGFQTASLDADAKNTEGDVDGGGDGEKEEEELEEEEEEEKGDNENDAEDDTALLASLPAFAKRPLDRVTRFHKVCYSVTRVPDGVTREWERALNTTSYSPGLDFPSENPFVATDFTIFPYSDDAEMVRLERKHGFALVKAGNGPNPTFKTNVMLTILSPIAYSSPLNRLYSRVMNLILQEAVTELSYFGVCASLQNKLQASVGGLAVSVDGPFDKLPRFIGELVKNLLCQQLYVRDASIFTICLDKIVRMLKGLAMSQPYELAVSESQRLTRCVHYNFEAMLAVVPSTSTEGFAEFVSQFFSQGLVYECFITGNMPSAEDMGTVILDPIERLLDELHIATAEKCAFPRFRDVYDMSSGCRQPHGVPSPPAEALSPIYAITFPSFNKNDPNVGVLYDIFVGADSATLQILAQCTVQLLSSHFFAALRTRETLGYIVSCQVVLNYQERLIRFSVQSAVEGVSGWYLVSRIAAFLDAVEQNIESIFTEELVKTVSQALIKKREKHPDTLAEQTALLGHAFVHPLGLSHRTLEIEALRKVTSDAVKDFVRTFVLNRRRSGTAVVCIVNNAASTGPTSDFTYYDASSPCDCGTACVVKLPARRANPDDGKEALPENTISLPDYSINAPCLPVTLVTDYTAFHKELNILKSSTL